MARGSEQFGPISGCLRGYPIGGVPVYGQRAREGRVHNQGLAGLRPTDTTDRQTAKQSGDQGHRTAQPIVRDRKVCFHFLNDKLSGISFLTLRASGRFAFGPASVRV